MKRLADIGIIIALIILMLVPAAYSQDDKEKKQAQTEAGVDNDKYIIGPEDVLFIHVWREEALTRTVPVRMDGKISMPLIEEVHAAGVTPLQLKEVLTRKFKQFIDNPVVSVTVMEANSFKVYVTGQVRSPGVFRLRMETTILQIITLAGGFTDLADQKNVTVIRKENGKDNRIMVNYKNIVSGEALGSNIFLKSGDTVLIPLDRPQETKEAVQKNPSQGEVEADSDRYVIGAEDALYIHVWKEEALTRTVPVRMDGNISLPLINEVKAAGLTPFQLKEALTKRFKDFIENPIVSVIVMEANSFKVYVSGQVRTPGVVRLRSETTILQLIPMVGGFSDWADQKKILVIRKEDGKEKRITINYKRIIDGKDLNSNIVLKSGDTIIIP